MLQTLKSRLVECEHPVGMKKTSNWKLPAEDFSYGKVVVPDKEGVSIVTRSWKTHEESKDKEPPQDFVKINKLAITIRAHNHSLNKDYRKTVDIRKVLPKGNNQRKIYLPPEDFVYGRRNRTPTPIKDIVNYEYARDSEVQIKSEYNKFIQEKNAYEKLVPKSTKFHDRFLESKKNLFQKEEKPLYKMKMFNNIGSKVVENIKKFKTSQSHTKDNDNNLDNLIAKVENELHELNGN